MRRLQRSVTHRAAVSLLVVAASLCATFIVLSIFGPRRPGELATPAVVQDERAVDGPVSYSAPARLLIKGIDVSAPVQPVGITSQGDMDIDDNPDQVAWYKLGPKPGEEGSAVIAGHYGWKEGAASVFNDIHTLEKGDEITTVGEDGRTLVFVVSRTAAYDPEQDATNVFRSDDGKAHLNLITCQGEWDKQLNTYSRRLVVFSELKA